MDETKRREYVERLQYLAFEGGDAEMNQREADDILCDILRSLGYDDIVAAYDEIYKWYA
mgnify:FL=1